MTLIIQKPTGARLVFSKSYSSAFADADVQAYLTAVEAADGQALEYPTAVAINDFVLGCKADGIWNAIKASCILAGARTLTGALVPLAGTAPTNFNFVSGDYNRKTGLVGDGSSKYLNANRNNNADPQNNKHAAVYIAIAGSPSAEEAVLGGGVGSGFVPTQLVNFATERNVRINDTSPSVAPRNTATGLWAISRPGASSVIERFGSANYSTSPSSLAPTADSLLIFARSIMAPGIISFYSGRLAFYSIGESLNLVLLDVRVTTLINAFAAAIP
jgi:hypothetical protein